LEFLFARNSIIQAISERAMAIGGTEQKPSSGIEIAGKLVSIASNAGGMFDCYLVTPTCGKPAPAMVLASAVYGVDADIRAIADEFAHNGYIAAAPDLFWRSIPGPLPSSDKRTRERSEPRLERIKMGEADISDTLAYLRRLPGFNGRAALMGLCYGGPYAIIGPKRLGYAAGISCHGSQMLDYLEELEGLDRPVCVIWGDKDHRASAEVLDAYRAAATRTPNLDLHIFSGIRHGYMMLGSPSAFDQKTRDFSMGRAFSLLEALAARVVAPSS
jgi:carboxymethylenebutenolidase